VEGEAGLLARLLEEERRAPAGRRAAVGVGSGGLTTRERGTPPRFAKTYIAIAKKYPDRAFPRLDGGQDGLAPEGGRRRRLAELCNRSSPAPPSPTTAWISSSWTPSSTGLTRRLGTGEFPLYPYDTSRLVFPPSVLATGYRQGQHGSYIEALAITGKEIWFGTPAREARRILRSFTFAPWRTHRERGATFLSNPRRSTGPPAGRQGTSAPEVGRPARRNLLPWPSRTVGGRHCGSEPPTAAWRGSNRAEDGWRDAGIPAPRAMPVENVSAIAQGLYDGKKQLLLEGHASAKGYGVKIFWVLDPATGEVRILHDGVKTPLPDSLAFSWATERRFRCRSTTRGCSGARPERGQRHRFPPAPPRFVVVGDANADDAPRLWRLDSATNREKMDGRTFKTPAGTKAKPYRGRFGLVDEGVCQRPPADDSRGPWNFSLPGVAEIIQTCRLPDALRTGREGLTSPGRLKFHGPREIIRRWPLQTPSSTKTESPR